MFMPISIGGFSAIGGVVTEDSQYRYHTFTESGELTVISGSAVATAYVIGGGGGANATYSGGSWSGAGGGASVGTVNLTPGSIPVTVGAGGAGVPYTGAGGSGGPSAFSGLSATGGTGAGYNNAGAPGGVGSGGNIANYNGGPVTRSTKGGDAGGYGVVPYSGQGGSYTGQNGGNYGGGGGGSDGPAAGNGARGVVVIRYPK